MQHIKPLSCFQCVCVYTHTPNCSNSDYAVPGRHLKIHKWKDKKKSLAPPRCKVEGDVPRRRNIGSVYIATRAEVPGSEQDTQEPGSSSYPRASPPCAQGTDPLPASLAESPCPVPRLHPATTHRAMLTAGCFPTQSPLMVISCGLWSQIIFYFFWFF